MERLFQILALILAGVAVYFLWKKNGDNAFVTAVFGAVTFFLSIRFQVKARIKQREIENQKKEAEGEELPQE
jgi:hypothetical protein